MVLKTLVLHPGGPPTLIGKPFDILYEGLMEVLTTLASPEEWSFLFKTLDEIGIPYESHDLSVRINQRTPKCRTCVCFLTEGQETCSLHLYDHRDEWSQAWEACEDKDRPTWKNRNKMIKGEQSS